MAIKSVVVLFAVLAVATSLACEFDLSGENVRCDLRTLNDGLQRNMDFSKAKTVDVHCSDAFFSESELKSEHFGNLPFLEELRIDFCKIRRVPSRAFAGLTNLKKLSVESYNSEWSSILMEVDGRALHNLRSVEEVNFPYNNIWSLPSEVMCNLPRLASINLTGNHFLEVSDLGLTSAEGCEVALTSLDLSGNYIASFQDSDLIQAPKLEKLNLANNRISILGDKALSGLNSLKELDLADNQLAALPTTLFNESASLEKLFLQNNSLTLLPSGIFEGLTDLIVLNLSRNAISTHLLSEQTFSGLARLQVLDLSWNQLSKIEASTFAQLAQLRVLSLNNNHIHTVKSESFVQMPRLNLLSLSFNKIEELSVIFGNEATTTGEQRGEGISTSSFSSSLSSLSLDHNRLRSVSLSAESVSYLKDLALNDNNLVAVPDFVSHARELRTVDLGDNHIEEISAKDFEGLAHLYGLRLSGNKLETVDNATFANLSGLHILNLAHNRLGDLEGGALHHLVELRALRLDNNRLKDLNGLVASLGKLQWLNVSSNELAWFDYAFIPASLEWLDMSHNEVTELGNFYDLQNFRLATLQAGFNAVRAVTVESFPRSLRHIYMNNNELSEIEPFSFAKMENLVQVDLSSNFIQSVFKDSLRIASPHFHQRDHDEIEDDDAESEHGRRPTFLLDSNPLRCDCQLEWIQQVNAPENAANFAAVSGLDDLECTVPSADNAILPVTTVAPEAFLCPYTAHCSAQCMCCDFYACDCRFQCPEGCSCFHDSTWEKNMVMCAEKKHRDVPLLLPQDASIVRLDGNSFRHLDTQSFLGRGNVRELYLNQSNILSLANNTFSGLTGLQVLHLEDNNIGEIRGYEFEALSNLRKLYLHNNDLVYINEIAFANLANLRELRLDGNLLTVFPVWKLLDNRALSSLTLSRNTWSCECDFIQPFNDYLEKRARIIVDYEIVQCVSDNIIDEKSLAAGGLNCGGDSAYLSRSLDSADDSDLASSAPSQIVAILVPTLLAAVVLVLGFLSVFVFRAKIKAWLYTKSPDLYEDRATSNSSVQSNGSAYGANGKLFDVYVSYSLQDADFVDERLAPTLEHETTSYKLCLHQRDFPANASLYDTVSVATESSSRVLVVLSRAYLEVEWPLVKVALRNTVKDNGKVIFLTVEDLSEAELERCPELSQHLNTCAFIRWGSAGYLQKLRFFLPEPAFMTFQRNITLRNQYRQTTSFTHPNQLHQLATEQQYQPQEMPQQQQQQRVLIYGEQATRNMLHTLQQQAHPQQQQQQDMYGENGGNPYQSIPDTHIYQSLEPANLVMLKPHQKPVFINKALVLGQQQQQQQTESVSCVASGIVGIGKNSPINRFHHEHSHSTSSGTQLLSNQGEEYIV